MFWLNVSSLLRSSIVLFNDVNLSTTACCKTAWKFTFTYWIDTSLSLNYNDLNRTFVSKLIILVTYFWRFWWPCCQRQSIVKNLVTKTNNKFRTTYFRTDTNKLHTYLREVYCQKSILSRILIYIIKSTTKHLT